MKKNRKRKIINRNIVMLVIVFVAVMAALIHSYAEESNVSQEEIESSDTIHNVNYSYTSDNEKYYQAFEYQDEMLAADSGTLSPDLAKVTVGLATAAYAESEIKACLSSMNYTLVDSKTFNYDGERKATYEDNDFVAFSIGYKKVSLNGETYNAYVVPIRGTTGNDEWLSNFKLGAAGDSYHYGFKKAADGVLNTLRSKIKTKNNIFLITGHSRGAAVANIVAGELTIDKDLASPNHIFGYTYACPAVKIGADTTLDNVININNPGDAIPELPLADWGYQRYGKSLSLSTNKKFYDNMKVQYKNALGREYAGILNTDSYVATLKTIAGTREAYFQPENQMLFELAGWLLGPKTKEMDTLAKILAHYNVNGLIGKSISNILSDITVSGIQTAFDKENQNNKEILITIDGYLEDTVNMNESEFEDWRTSISNTSTFEKLQDEMNITIRTRSDLVQLRKEVKEEMDSFSYTQSNLETILNLFYTTKGELKNAIFDGHTPLTYVKWINSTYYGWHGWKNNDDVKNIQIENNIKRIDISCFQECQNLNQVILPDTLEHVRERAFSGCTGIKELTMPVDLDYVKTYSSTDGYSSFAKCENIEKITYSKGKTGIMPDIEDGRCYTAEYYAGNNLTTVEFGEGVKNIGAEAYRLYRNSASSSYDYGMPNLKNIKLASTVKKIGDCAFYKNKAITDFDFSNIKELGYKSFYDCSGLSDLTISAEIKEIPFACFYGCTGISSLKIPETIEKVYGSAFTDCTGIKELTMPVDLDYVKTYSASTYTSDSSFGRCENIEKITYTKGKTGTMPDIESGSTSYYTAEYYAGKKLTTVEFQSGIEYIGAGSFDQASALKNIVLPCTVSAISSKTFCAINKSETVIYGTKDTYAEAYAKEQKIPFRGWNDPIITPEEPVAAPEEQVQLMGIAYTGVDEYVNISDWSVKECESKDTHIDENGLLTVGKDEPKGEIVVAACYGNYTETVKVRIVNPTYTVHFVGDITLDAKTDENCNVYCPKEYEEKGYEYQYYLGKDTDSEQIEEKDWPLTVAQDTEIYVKKILKEPSIDKINPTEKEMDFIYDGEKREISIFASHEIGEKGVLSYQWYYDDMQNGDFEEIHLATGASISVKDVKDSGVYKCRVTLCDGKDTTWVDSKMVRVNITQRVVLIPILQDSQKNLYYTGVEQKLLFEKLETDWVNITEAAATLPGNYVASVGLKDAENCIWADGTKEAKEYLWKIIEKETTPKPLESPTVTNAPTYEPGNTARPSGAPDENPSKTPEIKPGEVPTESPAATDTPTYEPGNTARPSGAPDENPERTPEIKASEVPTDVPEIKPTIAPDKITTGSQDTDLVFQPEDMTGDSREEALFLEKKVNVKKLQNKKKNKLYISWGKVELPQKAFYQVQISTKRNFKGAKNIYTTKSIYCYKGVKKGKKYYVRVRLGVTRDGKKIYGKWSNLKKKKIKN